MSEQDLDQFNKDKLNQLGLNATYDENETPIMQDITPDQDASLVADATADGAGALPVPEQGQEMVGVQQDPQVTLSALPEENSSQPNASYDNDPRAALRAKLLGQSSDAVTPPNAGPQTKINGPDTPVHAGGEGDKSGHPENQYDMMRRKMGLDSAGTSNDDLKNAQASRDRRQMSAGIFEGLSDIGQGFARGKTDTKFFDNMKEQANSGVVDIQERQKNLAEKLGMESKAAEGFVNMLNAKGAAEDNDPNSALAQSLRKAAEQQAPKLVSQLPPEEWKQMTPAKIKNFMDTYIKREDDQNARREDLKLKLADLKEKRTANSLEKQRQATEKGTKDDERLQEKVGNHLNTLDASSRKVLGVMVGNVRAADSVIELMDRKDLTPQDINGLAAPDLNRLVSGNVTVAGSQENQYHNLKMQAADLWQKVTSDPQSPDLPQLRAHIKSIAEQMKKISTDGIQQNTKFVGAQYSGWVKRHPEEFNQMVESAYGNPEGSYKNISSSNAAPQNSNDKKGGAKTVSSKQFSPSRNQTRITYSDGTTEVVDGKQE